MNAHERAMKITVQNKSGELTFDCGERESILYAGLRQGINLPFECATGTCGTCRARVTSGDVDVRWKDAPGGARLKPDKGDVLMCQTRARSDCLLRVPSELVVSDNAGPATRQGIIRGLRPLTRDVMRFDLHLTSPMSFQAGQFVVLEAAGIAGGRAYSMVNFENDVERLALVVKRKPGGRFGDWLFDNLSGEAEVEVFGPLGRAVFRPEEDRNFICIAGGSGIAGMMSMAGPELPARCRFWNARCRPIIFVTIRVRCSSACARSPTHSISNSYRAMPQPRMAISM